MGIKINKNRNVSVLTILDDLILDTVKEFAGFINNLISQDNKFVVLDLTGITFISSRGLGAIGKAADVLRRNAGDLKIFGMNEELKRMFDICGLTRIIDIYESEEDAVLSCGDNVSSIEKRLLWSINNKAGNDGSID